jgi:hypothetical protein
LGIFKTIKDWLSRFPWRIYRDFTGTAQCEIFTSTPLLDVKEVLLGNTIIEARLEALEAQFQKFADQIWNKIDERFEKIQDALKREEQLRQVEDTAIREKLKDDFRISAIGALFLSIGVILSTAAPEIVKW